MSDGAELRARPIGRVVRGRQPQGGGDAWEHRESEIEIDPALTEALEGLEAFSHVWVIWWADQAAAPAGELRIHPERREELPLVGLLATRSPHRPNPIGITAARLLERRENRLRVEGLDAWEGSPILDLKPYLRRGDLVSEANVPEWLQRLWQMHDAERGGPPAGEA